MEECDSLKCTVISCANYVNASPPEINFIEFPENYELRQKWKEKCGVASNHDITTAKVCSLHFRETDFCPLTGYLQEDAFPRENLSWMIGVMPPIPQNKTVQRISKPRKVSPFEKTPSLVSRIKVVDENERLTTQLKHLQNEQVILSKNKAWYQKKNNSMLKEIAQMKEAMNKIPRRKRGNVYENDLINKVFSPAQINMLVGKKKVVWNYDDLAMAFTLRHVGNKECYLYLKDTLNMPLPSLSCVQRWMASNKQF